MADAAHIPGPWFVAETFADEPGAAPETVIRGLDGQAVVAVALEFSQMPGTREANAALIAAAPDMQAVLQMVAEVIEDHQRGAKGTQFRHAYEDWTAAVMAVLLASRGIALAEPSSAAH